jgi:hypothetical protein
MQLLTFARRWVPALRVRRMRRLLRAAMDHPCYAAALRSSGLDSRAARRRVVSVEDGLASFPFLPFAAWQAGTHARSVHTPGLVQSPSRLEILGSIPRPGWRDTALAGSFEVLQRYARTTREARPSAEFAVLVLRRPDEDALAQHQRDYLWDAYEVPVYTVLVGYEGEVLANECEVEGCLHPTDDAVFEEHEGRIYYTSLTSTRRPAIRLETGLMASLVQSGCECGRAGLHLATAAEPVAAMASAAD